MFSTRKSSKLHQKEGCVKLLCNDLQKCSFDDKPLGQCCFLKQKSYKQNAKDLFDGVISYIRPELKKKFEKLNDPTSLMMCKNSCNTCINPNHLGSHLSNKENDQRDKLTECKPMKAFKDKQPISNRPAPFVKWCQVVFHRFQNQQTIAADEQSLSVNDIRGCSNIHATMDCYFPIRDKHLERAIEHSRKRKDQKEIVGQTSLNVIKVDPYSQCPSPEYNPHTIHNEYNSVVSFK